MRLFWGPSAQDLCSGASKGFATQTFYVNGHGVDLFVSAICMCLQHHEQIRQDNGMVVVATWISFSPCPPPLAHSEINAQSKRRAMAIGGTCTVSKDVWRLVCSVCADHF
eukprot:s721_g37.t1